MKRAALLALAVCLSAAPGNNTFESAWSEWATLANARARRPGTVDAREPLAWARVKREFRQLEKQMDAFYRGDR